MEPREGGKAEGKLVAAVDLQDIMGNIAVDTAAGPRGHPGREAGVQHQGVGRARDMKSVFLGSTSFLA